MRPVEVTIIAVSDELLSVSMDYHGSGSPAVKRWTADRRVIDSVCDGLEEVLHEAAESTFTDAERAESTRQTEDRLVSLGLALFQETMKEEGDTLRELVKSDREERCLIFRIDKAVAYIPLELMHDGGGFLSQTLAMGRIILTEELEVAPHSDEKSPHKILIVGDPTDDPSIRDDVEREIGALKSVFAGRKTYSLKIASGREVDRGFMLSNMPGAAVFHFTGHGVVSDDPESTGIRLQGDRILSGRALRGLQQPPGVVFLNMCTASPRSAWKGSLGIVETLLRRGVRACVASLWDLRSKTAATIASRFYGYLLQGEPFGHALRRARLDAIRSTGLHDPTWAAYALYGDPRLTLLSGLRSRERRRRTLRVASAALGIIVYLALALFPGVIPEETNGNGRESPVGYLVVESNPGGADVRVDGEDKGRTARTLELPVGRHHLELNKEGYPKWEAWVVVRESLRTYISADLVELEP
jgi:hypothetical protein